MNDRAVKYMLNSVYGVQGGKRGWGRVVALDFWKNSEAYLIGLIRIKLRRGLLPSEDLDAAIRCLVMYRRQARRACFHIRSNVNGSIDPDFVIRYN